MVITIEELSKIEERWQEIVGPHFEAWRDSPESLNARGVFLAFDVPRLISIARKNIQSRPCESNPKCPDGHGPMTKTPGHWALVGVDLSEGEFTHNDDGCILKVWSCPTCKQARIYADDTEEV